MGAKKLAWMMDYCRVRGLSPAERANWVRAGKAYNKSKDSIVLPDEGKCQVVFGFTSEQIKQILIDYIKGTEADILPATVDYKVKFKLHGNIDTDDFGVAIVTVTET